MTQTPTRSSVLIVDDEPEMAHFVGAAAEEVGLIPVVSNSGAAFTEIYGRTENVVGIVMDVMMPEIDGIELVRWIAEAGTEPPPLLVMTGNRKAYAEMLVELARAAGIPIAGVLAKPFSLDEIEMRLRAMADDGNDKVA